MSLSSMLLLFLAAFLLLLLSVGPIDLDRLLFVETNPAAFGFLHRVAGARAPG
jgi:hypothetical protein